MYVPARYYAWMTVLVLPNADVASVAIYVLGVLSAGLSILIVRTQHDYYRAARDRMRRVEAVYEIPEVMRVDTTTTLGNRSRLASVHTLVQCLLGAVIVANAVGIIIAATT